MHRARRTFRHRCQQGPHGLRMPAQTGQAHGGGALADGQIQCHQTARRQSMPPCDPLPGMFTQTGALQSAEYRQGQDDDQQVAVLGETFPDLSQQTLRRHACGQSGGQCRGHHHQHGIPSAHEADDDNDHGKQGPVVHGRPDAMVMPAA